MPGAGAHERPPPPPLSGTRIRPATGADLAAIGQILNAAIAEGSASWRGAPHTAESLTDWLAARQREGTARVMERGGRILGVAAAGAFRAGAGYAHTREHSVYVAPAARRAGVGTALLHDIVAWATAAGHHRLVGAISADQPASIALHARCGFTECGRLPEVGRIDGTWRDLVLMVRALG